MRNRKAAWRSIPSSSWNPRNFVLTRFVWKAATLLQTLTATHERRNYNLVYALPAGGVSRHQSRHGVAVRGGSRDAGASHASRRVVAAAHRFGPRALHRRGGSHRSTGAGGAADVVCPRRGGGDPGGAGRVQA